MGFGGTFILALLPQLLLAFMAIVCGVLGVIRPRERPDLHRWIAVIALLGAVATCGLQLAGMRLSPRGIGLSFWNGGFVVDRFSMFVTVLAALLALLTALLSDTYVRRIRTRAPLFFALVLLTVLAVSALASEHELVTMVVSLQLAILCAAAIVATLKTDPLSVRGAWLLLRDGVLGASFVLYGVAILIGTTGNDSATAVGGASGRAPALVGAGVALVLLGLGVFAALAPLHRWVCRVAQSLPAVPAGFVVSMLVVAGSVAVLRFTVSGLGPGVRVWSAVLSVLVAVTAIVAALMALRSVRITHLVAACVSAQSSFLLMALLNTSTPTAGGPGEGPAAFLFALAVFGIAIVGTFSVLSLLQNAGLEDEPFAQRGLALRSPVAGLLLAFALATLAGFPPLAGFVARLFIITSTIDAGFGWTAIVALVAAIATAAAVGRFIASMYAEGGEELPFDMSATPRLGRVVAMTSAVAAFFLTVLAQPLLLLARGGAGPIL